MLLTRATDIADSLRMNLHITLEPHTILYCITYLLLMPALQGCVSEQELSRCYMGEGLVPLTANGKEDIDIGRALAITKALLMEIVNCENFEFDYGATAETNEIYVQMDWYLWEALIEEKYQQ
ncbi:hypothetical protein MRB53_023605 [Persea americana]|uniref:Uncharacterized protein n=1 Tax=Persea americana TaxID=3435 RepID=A0ACC2L9V8_PERAE|nr:hypothetical protein MRB53_023605 [Persea americana]